MSRGKQGTSTAGMEYSAARRARKTKKLRAEENRWAAKAGPVTVTFVGTTQQRSDGTEPT